MSKDMYSEQDLKSILHGIVSSEKIELVFLLEDFNSEEEFKEKIAGVKQYINSIPQTSWGRKDKYKETLDDLDLLSQVLFGDFDEIPLEINGCFKDLAAWRLKHGR